MSKNQVIIIPQGVVREDENVVIDIPRKYKWSPVIVARNRIESSKTQMVKSHYQEPLFSTTDGAADLLLKRQENAEFEDLKRNLKDFQEARRRILYQTISLAKNYPIDQLVNSKTTNNEFPLKMNQPRRSTPISGDEGFYHPKIRK